MGALVTNFQAFQSIKLDTFNHKMLKPDLIYL